MINKSNDSVEIIQEETKIRYEYGCDYLFVETGDDEGAVAFEDKSYTDISYKYLGDSDEVREFVMTIAKERNKGEEYFRR